MRTAILIDDEPMALEGLSLLIDWAAEGFSVTAQFGSAQAALDHLQRHAPDLVVTDLYMPGMDGLALMQRARAQGFAGHFVIVSGYQDFDMAQQALRYGAVGYLLKPVDPEEAAQTLREVSRLLTARPEHNLHWQLRTHALAQVQALLLRPDAPQDRLPQGGLWQLLSLGQPLPPAQMPPLETLLSGGGGSAFDAVLEGTQLLALHAPTEAALRSAVAALSADVRLRSRTLLTSGITAEGPTGLSALAVDLRAALATLRQQGEALLSAMAEQLSLLEQEKLREGMRALIPLARSHSAQLESALLDRWWHSCYALFAREPEEAQAFLHQLGTEQALRELPLEIGLARISATALSLLRQRDDSLEERMLRYVKAHYSQSISLATMAQALGHNSAYLGRVFRRRMGQSFRPWLNSYRLDIAARRIVREKEPIHLIAEAVGYTKYAYFLEKFKAAYGMMPDAYRKACSALHAADVQPDDKVLLQERIDDQDRHG